MRKKAIKIILLMIITFLLVNILVSINNEVLAMVNPTEDMDYWRPSEGNESGELEEKVGSILGIISVIGIFTSVITLSTIGIKFMLGSVEQKAQYKQRILPWLAGAFLVFSITSLPTFIYELVTDGTIIQAEEVNLTINQSSATLKLGENEEIALTVMIDSGKNKKITWVSSNNNIATVDQNGKVIARREGTVTITAISGKSEVSCDITVEAVKTTSIVLSQNSVNLDENAKTCQLVATITPENSIESVNWKSSDNKIATVKDGLVTAIKSGTVTITATSGTQTATCTVQVDFPEEVEEEEEEEEIEEEIEEEVEENDPNLDNALVDNKEDGWGPVPSTEGLTGYSAKYYNKAIGTVVPVKMAYTDIGFWIYSPQEDVKETEGLPLIIFLHGMGNLRKQS